MSENPVQSPLPTSVETSPYVAVTTKTIERANRLMSVRANPGFYEIVKISQEIARTADDILLDYPGWDTTQIMVLKVRAQCAKEHHELLISKIQDAIQAGIDEGRALEAKAREARAQGMDVPEKSIQDTLDQGDYVRQEVLKQFEEYDSRPAGSF